MFRHLLIIAIILTIAFLIGYYYFTPPKDNTMKSLKKLATLYHHGVPDKYSKNGTKIKGIKPNIKKAIYCYCMLIQNGYVDYILDLASIFHYGGLNFEPKLDIAEKLYQILITNGNKWQSETAKQQLVDLRESTKQSVHDDEYYQETKDVGNMTEERTEPIYNLDRLYEGNGYYITDNLRDIERHNTTEPNYNALVNDIFNYDFAYMQPTINRNNAAYDIVPELRRYRRQYVANNNGVPIRYAPPAINSQNVHDTGVSNSVKQAVNKIAKNTLMTKTVQTSVNEIKQLIDKSNVGHAKKQDAIKALNHIVSTDGHVSKINMSEVDALNLVWNRIHDPKNHNQRENLKETLVNELAECIEHNSTVCTQGRASRIIDTLNVVDPDVKIKDDSTLRQEMLMKASKIQQKIYNNLPDPDKNIINKVEPSDQEQPIVDTYEHKLKNAIRSELHKDYVDTELMTQNKLDSEINKWINDVV